MWFVFAAASALSFGLRGILYQWTSKRPIDRNVMLLGVYVSGMLIALAAGMVVRQPWTVEAWLGVLMGLFSYVANASMYKGFAVARASLIAIFTALPPVVVVVLAYLFWGETLNSVQLSTFLLIVAGIIMLRYSNDLSLRNLKGAQWGLLTMLFFALTDLTSKQATLAGASTFPALVTMYATGSLLFGLSWWLDRSRKARIELAAGASEVAAASSAESESVKTTIPVMWPSRKSFLWGMLVGITNICGMMFALPAFRLGITGLVSAVLAMNVVMVLLYARLVLKEKFTRLEVAGLSCAILGMVLLRLAA
ncbi:EamA family transporter [Paenibacillus sp. GD4]|uniref:EamA family transporter n=1 Tax=Paenibacillus sp. GD4 TaxID=3068890 RepID=UPI002796D5CC|nr:EamA family transporter [Paenibacillus sp. GD4]MDQ1909740.1 EamA family transporter [Paenibacillus sp. GD4]